MNLGICEHGGRWGRRGCATSQHKSASGDIDTDKRSRELASGDTDTDKRPRELAAGNTDTDRRSSKLADGNTDTDKRSRESELAAGNTVTGRTVVRQELGYRLLGVVCWIRDVWVIVPHYVEGWRRERCW